MSQEVAGVSRISYVGSLAMRGWLDAARRDLFIQVGGHFASLDGIRAMGALLVVAFHSYVCAAHAAGVFQSDAPTGAIQWLFAHCWAGVDIVFVLSGFLIGRILFLELLRGGGINFKSFYVRRTFRIVPAYYTVLTLSLLVLVHLRVFQFMYGGATWVDLLRRSPANYLYVSNYLFGFFIPNALNQSWSLCVEEHFYLVVPATLVVTFKAFRGRWRFGIFLALIAFPAIARYRAYLQDPLSFVAQNVYYGSHTHSDGLLLGVAVGYCFVFERERLSRAILRVRSLVWVLASLCFACAFAWGGLFVGGFFPVVLQFTILAVGSTFLLLNCLLLDNSITRVLAHPVWYPVARLSYGIYLVHPFAILLLLAVWPGGSATLLYSGVELALFAACGAGLSTGAATVLFLVVERPMLAGAVSRPAAREVGRVGARESTRGE